VWQKVFGFNRLFWIILPVLIGVTVSFIGAFIWTKEARTSIIFTAVGNAVADKVISFLGEH
jgi:hypothetical protein